MKKTNLYFGMLLCLCLAKAEAMDIPTPTGKCISTSTYCPGKGWVKSSCTDPNPCGFSSPSPPSRPRSSGGGASLPSAGGGGLDASQQMGLQIMQGVLTGLMAPDPAADARRAAELQRQAEENARLAAIARAEAEARHQKLVGELKGVDSGGLALKTEGGNSLGLKLGDAVEVASATPQLLRTEANAGSAPGHRIVDCKEAKAAHDRMQTGLPLQKDLIQKTEAQLLSARSDAKVAKGARNSALSDAVVSEAKGLALSTLQDTAKIGKALEKLRASGKLSPEKMKQWGEYASELNSGAENLKKFAKSGKAGFAAGKNWNNSTQSVTDSLWKANNFLVESGIAEELGEKLALAGGGPMGALAFKGAKLSIDAGVSAAQAHFSEAEALQAEKNLGIMREQASRVESRIQELSQDLAEHCQ